MDSVRIRQALLFFLSSPLAALSYLLSRFGNIIRYPIFATLYDSVLSLYFRFCGLSPCTIDLDDQTVMHFWTTNQRLLNKPDLVLVHGFGGNSKWQFLHQVGPLSKSFNLYVPDLLFFGNSRTNRSDRSVVFQARCVGEGLKRLGVDRYSVFGISYGGYVAYRMADIYREEVDKVVIASSGICYNEEQKMEHYRKLGIGRGMLEILLPDKPDGLRFLVKLSMYKLNPLKWTPDFFIREVIKMMCNQRKEKIELLEHLEAKKSDSDHLPILTQETLLLWGDQDIIFPLILGHQLQRHLGPKSKLEIIKDTGHAANLESPDLVNDLIKSFFLGNSKFNVQN